MLGFHEYWTYRRHCQRAVSGVQNIILKRGGGQGGMGARSHFCKGGGCKPNKGTWRKRPPIWIF